MAENRRKASVFETCKSKGSTSFDLTTNNEYFFGKTGTTFLKQPTWENYEKVRLVGKGAFGRATLYRKKEKDEEFLVVLKEINMHDLNCVERQLAINEVKVLSVLHHPNIVTYYDSFEFDGNLIIEMEYCDGGTIADFLSQLTKPLKEFEILVIFYQIVSAITYLHDSNILHRDLKTANIFMTKETVVKVGDFGISKMLTTHKAGASTVVGTPHYISPEICEGKSYNKKSDIWALGCILYEMACLQKTFEGTNLPALINKIVKGQFAPIKRSYSNEFKILINDLLQKDPELRPHAYEVQDDVYELLSKSRWNCVNQEAFSAEFTTGAPYIVREPTKQQPRSILYEVHITKSNITLEKIPFIKRERIKSFARSTNHFLVLTFDSAVYSWGYAAKGQLGLGPSSTDWVNKATCIEAIRGKNVVKVCAGENFSMFLTRNGLVMTCGDGKTSCLGQYNSEICSTPKLLDTLLDVDIADIACGPYHAIAITDSGRVFAWGCNIDGRLGIGRSGSYVDTPSEIPFPPGTNIKHAYCGLDATMFVDVHGGVWACGSNSYNKLGLSDLRSCFKFSNKSNVFEPTKLKWLTVPVSSVHLGQNNSSLLLDTGNLIIFGSNEDGQLGHGHTKVLTKPKYVRNFSSHPLASVQCGSTFTVASTLNNEVYFWGGRYIDDLDDVTPRSYYMDLYRDKRCVDEAGITLDSISSTVSESSDVIKIGESNWALMEIVEKVGPDYPVMQVKDPKVIVNSLRQLKILSSPKSKTKRDIILKPQAIIVLYSSQVHLQFGETVTLSNIYCFNDDRVFLTLETTIPLEAEIHRSIKRKQHRTFLPVVEEVYENQFRESFFNESKTLEVPGWVEEEARKVSISSGLVRSSSFPISADKMKTLDAVRELEEELQHAKAQVQESMARNTLYEEEIRELQEQIIRLRRLHTARKFKSCFVQ